MLTLTEKLERMKLWLEYEGGYCNNILECRSEVKAEYQFFSKRRKIDLERGLHAKNDIPPKETLMVISRHCIITEEMGKNLPIGRKIESSGMKLNSSKHVFLVLFLLWDRKNHGVKSFFYPYYDLLPQSFCNIPLYWTPEEMKFLEGSFLIAEINRRIKGIAEDYSAICEIAPEMEKLCSLQEFQWAYTVVITRNFGVELNNGVWTSALVPQADMLNHRRPPQAEWKYDLERDAFTVTTLENIPAGSQIYQSYGKKSNHRYLLSYGFSVEDNIEEDGTCPNQVSIEIDLSWADPEFPDKAAFWIADGYFDSDDESSMSYVLPPHESLQADHFQADSVGVGDMGASTLDVFRSSQNDEKYRVSMDFCKSVNVRIADDENTKLLFSFLRTIVCNLDEVAFLNRMSMTCDDILKPISLRNELTAMKLLKEIIVDHLARYPTTIQDDIENLMDKQAYPPNSNRRNAKIQVKGEKEVLCHFLLWAQSSILVLEAIQCDRKNACLNEYNLSCHENFSAAMEELYEAEVHWTILNHCKNVLNDLL